tara:strand:+ start:115 stop:282 length:168 start_codon:yes stop_codon:yes gene_type:complete
MVRKRNPRVKPWYNTFSKKTSYRVIVDDRRTRTNKRMVAIFNTKKEADNYTKRIK